MSKFTNSPQFQMDDLKEIKKIAEDLYKSREFEQAAQKYIKALENLMDSDCKTKTDNSERANVFDFKTEATKIYSNISLMYFNLWETNKSQDSIRLSVKYAKKAIEFDPLWFKGYLRLSKAYYSQKENDNAIDAMMKCMSFAKDKDVELVKPHLKELKFYTNEKVIHSSPSYSLLNFPKNVYVIDPNGAGHFTNLYELVAKYESSITNASILVRPGVYIGTHFFSDSRIDIVGDCNVETDPNHKAIISNPPVVFRNVGSSVSDQKYCTYEDESGLPRSDKITFAFDQSKIQMKRLTVEECVMYSGTPAIYGLSSNIDIDQCSVRSICSVSVATGHDVNLTINASTFVDVYGAVMVAGKNTSGTLKNCIINNTVGIGVEVRDNAKLVELDSCTVTNTKQSGLNVYNGAKRAKVLRCVFEANNIEKTIHEGAIQLKSCKAKIQETVIKNQKGSGIVIEDGKGTFLKLTITKCYFGILVQAGVVVKECNISGCQFGIKICEIISDPVVLESNAITECFYDVGRLPRSPKPAVKGQANYRIEEIYTNDVLAGCNLIYRRKLRSKKYPQGLNIGPLGDVLGINEKQEDPFIMATSRLSCRHCGYTKAQVLRKLKTCDRCKMPVYCSRACQKKAWKTHKPMCESNRRAIRAYKKAISLLIILFELVVLVLVLVILYLLFPSFHH